MDLFPIVRNRLGASHPIHRNGFEWVCCFQRVLRTGFEPKADSVNSYNELAKFKFISVTLAVSSTRTPVIEPLVLSITKASYPLPFESKPTWRTR